MVTMVLAVEVEKVMMVVIWNSGNVMVVLEETIGGRILGHIIH